MSHPDPELVEGTKTVQRSCFWCSLSAESFTSRRCPPSLPKSGAQGVESEDPGWRPSFCLAAVACCLWVPARWA